MAIQEIIPAWPGTTAEVWREDGGEKFSYTVPVVGWARHGVYENGPIALVPLFVLPGAVGAIDPTWHQTRWQVMEINVPPAQPSIDRATILPILEFLRWLELAKKISLEENVEDTPSEEVFPYGVTATPPSPAKKKMGRPKKETA